MKKSILLGILIAGFGLTTVSTYAGGDKKAKTKKECAKACSTDKKAGDETAKKSCCSKPKS